MLTFYIFCSEICSQNTDYSSETDTVLSDSNANFCDYSTDCSTRPNSEE